MKEAFDEALFKFLKKRLESELKEAKKGYFAEMCDDLSEAIELCDRLLTFDYFKNSEAVIDKWSKKSDIDKYALMCRKWKHAYNVDSCEKKKDMKRLFSIIATNCEDWC